jgi:hypothetical protein
MVRLAGIIVCISGALSCLAAAQPALAAGPPGMPLDDPVRCASVGSGSPIKFQGRTLIETPDLPPELRQVNALVTVNCLHLAQHLQEAFVAAHPDDYQVSRSCRSSTRNARTRARRCKLTAIQLGSNQRVCPAIPLSQTATASAPGSGEPRARSPI